MATGLKVFDMKKILLIALVLPFFLVGCETMEGLGKDVQKLGEKIEKESKD